MPKLNYTKRKSDGPKLGAIVRKDLGKRIKPGTAHRDSSAIELNLEGKTLTDDGVGEVAAGLVEIFAAPDTTERLHALNLAGNALTAASLRLLAPAINAAAPALQDLDLSANDIAISTAEDAISWKAFLAALSKCRHLKRLNLSHNHLSLSTTWDVFLRLYLQQLKQYSSLWQSSTSDDENALQDEDEDDDENESVLTETVAELHIDANGSGTSGAGAFGLPSIIQIDVSDNGMTDACCLFLSYVVERHRFLQGKIAHSAGSGVAGSINWQPNDKLGPVGTKMIKLAESVVWQPIKEGTRRAELKHSLHQLFEHSFEARRVALPQTYLSMTDRVSKRTNSSVPLAARTRRSSQASTETHVVAKTSSHHKDNAIGELESLRRKLQRGIIEEGGLQSVPLWMNALGLLAIVRQHLVPLRPGMIQGGTTFAENWDGSVPSPLEGWTSITAPPAARGRLLKAVTHAQTINTQILPPPGWVAPHFTMEEWPEPHSQTSLTESEAQVSPSTTTKTIIEDKGSQDGRLPALPPPTHPTKGRLPHNVLEKIFCFMADPDNVLSETQRRNVVAWGQNRSTLTIEQEALGKPRSVQIWRVLEAVDCLAYDESG